MFAVIVMVVPTHMELETTQKTPKGTHAKKAHGGDGSKMSRDEFEKYCQAYFADLQACQKDNKKKSYMICKSYVL